MKKFILSLAIMLMMAFSVNAQIATENSKVFDNTYVGVEAGVTTPLDFNSVFPLNTVAGVKLGKEITPVFGLEAEGQVFFNDNNVGRWTNTFVKGTNVGLNGTVNLSNLLFGYKGTPRFFEVKTNTGFGWLHRWNTSDNALTAKTALDLDFNFGKTKAHTVSVTPGVYWNLVDGATQVQFNKNRAQLGVFVGYVYHFKTSNGTRHFKTYDVGAMLGEIDRLNAELAKKPNEVVREVVKTVEVPVTNTVATVSNASSFVFFAQNSSVLTDDAKAVLDNVTGTVDVVGYASPEGTREYNQALSERRAAVVADYLIKRGVTVNSNTGAGVNGDASGRVAVITVK